MQFECSYMMTYDEATDSEELKMRIDSVSVVPKESRSVESICCVEGDQMGQVRWTSSLGQCMQSFNHFRPGVMNFVCEARYCCFGR